MTPAPEQGTVICMGHTTPRDGGVTARAEGLTILCEIPKLETNSITGQIILKESP